MINNDDVLLTPAQRERVKQVQEMLDRGGNPFAHIRLQNQSDKKGLVKGLKKRGLSVKKLEQKWNPNSNIGEHVRVERGFHVVKKFKHLDVPSQVDVRLRCLICDQPISEMGSLKGKIIVGSIGTETVEQVMIDHTLVDVVDVKVFPKYKSGSVGDCCREALLQLATTPHYVSRDGTVTYEAIIKQELIND